MFAQGMKYLLSAGIVLLFCRTATAQEIEWQESLEGAFKKSAEIGKPVLVHFWQPG